jgi:hypothetical protein
MVRWGGWAKIIVLSVNYRITDSINPIAPIIKLLVYPKFNTGYLGFAPMPPKGDGNLGKMIAFFYSLLYYFIDT